MAGNWMYALSAKSKNLDGAWEFLRYYLTQEYQDKIQEQEYNLPVLRSTFEKNVQDATKKPYYMDENGNKVEYDETYYINGGGNTAAAADTGAGGQDRKLCGKREQERIL